VEETPKGWFITLIRKDTAEELDREARAKRDRAELDEDERVQLGIRQQVGGSGGAAAAASGGLRWWAAPAGLL
jgi:hypothetical protein